MDGLFYDHNKKRLNEIRDILDVLIKENVVKPIKTTVFDYSECEQAFRYLKFNVKLQCLDLFNYLINV